MSTSTPPAWHWLSECEEPLLSTAPRILPDTAPLREQNDSDQCANGEQSPPSALIPSDQCDECRAAPGQPHAPACESAAQLTDAQSCAVPEHPDCDISCSPDVSCDRKHDNLDDGEPLVKVESCPECGAVADIDYGVDKRSITIPLWKQALWLARHIESLRSPRPDVVSDDELRGMTLIRVLGIGADEHGDDVFRKGSPELRKDRAEEWSDGEFYDLVDQFGDELDRPSGQKRPHLFPTVDLETADHDGVAGTVAT